MIGLSLGLFGVGGSSVATPVLSLLGVPPLAAIASPLPATIGGAVLASIPYVRESETRPRAAAWTLVGGIPGAVIGALASRWAGGGRLLIASGVVLIVAGVRVALPIAQRVRDAGERRRKNRPLLVVASFVVGLFTGLLANGGGFILVPLYLLAFGLRMRQAVGTSLLVVAALAVPTLLTHAALGHIDWNVAWSFTAGVLPASIIGGSLAHRFEGPHVRRAFGIFLVLFGAAFTAVRIARFG